MTKPPVDDDVVRLVDAFIQASTDRIEEEGLRPLHAPNDWRRAGWGLLADGYFGLTTDGGEMSIFPAANRAERRELRKRHRPLIERYSDMVRRGAPAPEQPRPTPAAAAGAGSEASGSS
jgi:hypothetical protein